MDDSCEKSGEGGAQGSVSRSCHCGRGEKRPGQRNCRLCHAEANRRYRASVKKQNEALKAKLEGKGVR